MATAKRPAATVLASSSSSSAAQDKRQLIDNWFDVATGGAVQLPALPSVWVDEPLNPAAPDAKADDAMRLTVEFLKKARIRNIYLLTDKIVEFSNIVAGEAMRGGDQYSSSAQSAVYELDRLIINYAVKTYRMFLLEARGPSTNNKTTVDPRLIPELYKEGLFRSISSYYGGSGGAQRTEEERLQLERATKRQQEALLTSAYKQAAEKKGAAGTGTGTGPGSAKASGLSPSFALTAANVTPGVRVPVAGASTVNPADMHGPVFPPQAPSTGYKVLSPAESAAKAAAAAAATAQKSDTDTDAVVSQKALLTHMVINNIVSEPALKAVRLIFGPDNMLLDDPERQRRDIENMERLERLLHKADAAGSDLIDIPQHTGWLVFSPEMMSAISRAMGVIHGACRKSFAIEVDLMTHVTVRGAFASLVAYFLNARTASKVAVLGGSGASIEARRKTEYARLKDAFDKLIQVATFDPETGEPMMVLSFSNISYDVPLQRDITQRRQIYMSSHHKYYTDASQMRPFNPTIDL